MPTKRGWSRPDAAKLFHTYESMAFDGADKVITMNQTVDQTDWSVLTNITYTDREDGATTVVTSGLFMLFENTLGILMHDTEDTTTGTFAISGRILAPITTGQTPAIGDAMYWDTTTEKLTPTSPGATAPVVGIALGTAETLAAGNDLDLPAGDYCQIVLHPVQTRL